MDTLIAILFSYAVTISGLNYNDPPIIEIKKQEFFQKEACEGNSNCPVYGWYPHSGNIIYISNKLDLTDKFSDSIIVHEIVHYLQYKNKKYVDSSCINMIQLEHQAYFVQASYLMDNKVDKLVRFDIRSFSCKE